MKRAKDVSFFSHKCIAFLKDCAAFSGRFITWALVGMCLGGCYVFNDPDLVQDSDLTTDSGSTISSTDSMDTARETDEDDFEDTELSTGEDISTDDTGDNVADTDDSTQSGSMNEGTGDPGSSTGDLATDSDSESETELPVELGRNGEPCNKGTQCESQHCDLSLGLCCESGGVCCRRSSECEGGFACDVDGSEPTYTCFEACSGDHSKCKADHFCNGELCLEDLKDGEFCTAPSQCLSKYCDNSICCESGRTCCVTDGVCPDGFACDTDSWACFEDCANNDSKCQQGYECAVDKCL